MSTYLANITKREVLGGGVMEREAWVFGCKLVGVVNGAVTTMAKSSFICRAEDGGFHFVTHSTLDLHLFLLFFFLSCALFVCVLWAFN